MHEAYQKFCFVTNPNAHHMDHNSCSSLFTKQFPGSANGKSCHNYVLIACAIWTPNEFSELSITAFRESADLTKYNWIHFEGRPTMTTFDLVRFVNEERLVRGLRFTVSVEIEKADHGLEALLPLADLVFVSKDFSKFSGAQSSKEAVGILKNRIAKGGYFRYL